VDQGPAEASVDGRPYHASSLASGVVPLRRCTGAPPSVQLDSPAAVLTEVPMRLIGLAVVLAVSLFAAPLVAETQEAKKVYRLGFLGNSLPTNPDGLVGARNLNELIEGLRWLGYVEGQNLIIERRYAEGRAERWPELASELVGLKVDVIVVVTTPAALAAKRASDTIPIVAPSAIDPVAAGLASSLARPGGNVTGIATLAPELSAKGLSLLKEAVPRLATVSVLWNAGNPANAAVWKHVEDTARALSLKLHALQVRAPKDFEAVFGTLTQDRPDGFLAVNDALIFQHRRQIADFARQKRLPSVFQLSEYAEVGGLMSYGGRLLLVTLEAARLETLTCPCSVRSARG